MLASAAAAERAESESLARVHRRASEAAAETVARKPA